MPFMLRINSHGTLLFITTVAVVVDGIWLL